MKSMSDAVMEHAKEVLKNGGGTYFGLEFLELKDREENFGAANLYVAALDVINKLQKRIEELETK